MASKKLHKLSNFGLPDSGNTSFVDPEGIYNQNADKSVNNHKEQLPKKQIKYSPKFAIDSWKRFKEKIEGNTTFSKTT